MVPVAFRPSLRYRWLPGIVMMGIALFFLVILQELAMGPDKENFLDAAGTIPFEITKGLDVSPLLPYPVYFALFTSLFLHDGFVHFVASIAYFWVFGYILQMRMGRYPFILFFIVVGVIANYAQVFVDATSRIPSLGPSPVIAGMLAAFLVFYREAKIRKLVFYGDFVPVNRSVAGGLVVLWLILQWVASVAGFGLPTQQSSGNAYWVGIVVGFVVGGLFAYVHRAIAGDKEAVPVRPPMEEEGPPPVEGGPKPGEEQVV